jgi:hypothetical protein
MVVVNDDRFSLVDVMKNLEVASLLVVDAVQDDEDAEDVVKAEVVAKTGI